MATDEFQETQWRIAATADTLMKRYSWLAWPSVAIPGIVILVLVVGALLAPVISTQDPYRQQLTNRFAPVGTTGHPLGADNLGRDELSRLLHGARRSLFAGVVPAALTVLIGGIIGLVTGYLGGLLDGLLMRIADVVMSFPVMVLAVVLVASLGPSLVNAMLAVTVIATPGAARIIRSEVIVLRESVMIQAGKVLGYTWKRLVFRELLPHVMPVAFALFTVNIGWMLLAVSGLSFLGLGAQPPDPEWGRMIGEAREHLRLAPHLTLVPGGAITATVIAFALLGDAIQRRLHPRERVA